MAQVLRSLVIRIESWSTATSRARIMGAIGPALSIKSFRCGLDQIDSCGRRRFGFAFIDGALGGDVGGSTT